MTVNDIINNNDNVDVTIHGVDKENPCNPMFKEYFSGKLRDIPKHLRSCEVLNTGLLMGKQVYCIEIPYIEIEDKTMTEENIYQENGYEDREDYLTCLAEDFAISIDTVYCLLNILGDEEDFDLLISALEEAMYLSQENSY